MVLVGLARPQKAGMQASLQELAQRLDGAPACWPRTAHRTSVTGICVGVPTLPVLDSSVTSITAVPGTAFASTRTESS